VSLFFAMKRKKLSILMTCNYVIVCRQAMFWIIIFGILLALVIIIVYLRSSHQDNIENYFQNKVVWITGKNRLKIFFLILSVNLGASSGIGRELAKQLAQCSPSTRLILSARRENELLKLKDELNLDCDQCLVLPLNLELQNDCFRSKVELVLERFGHIDVLINNAGISQRSLIRDTVYNVDARLMNINFLGTITLTKTVLKVNSMIDIFE